MRAASSTRRRALAAAVLALGVVAAACGPSAPPSPPGCPGGPPDALTSTVFNRTNAERGAHGLGHLAWDGRLACLASEWAHHLAGSGQFHHRDLGATIRSPGYESYRRLGENILTAPRPVDGNAMHDAWMRSATHRAQILGDFDSMGVGIAYPGSGGVRAVANFGRRY